MAVGSVGVITEARRDRGFCFGTFAPEQPRKSNEHVSYRRIVRATEQRRNVKARTCCRFPRDCWTDGETVHGIAARVLRRDILIFHFYADFQAFVRQENRHHRSLREAPLAPTVPGVLFFKEPVHGPFDALEEILGKEKTNFVRIGNLGWSAFFLLFFSFAGRRWNFFVSNSADTEFVFGEHCWVERNLVPISQSPSGFQTPCLRAATAVKSLELCFGRYVKTIGQTHFDLLGEKIIRRPMAESLALKKFPKEK